MVLDNRGACLDNDDFCICFQNSFEESYFYTFNEEVFSLLEFIQNYFLNILQNEVLYCSVYFVVKPVKRSGRSK